MAKTREGYQNGWIQYEAEPDDDVEVCDECNADPQAGETYWAREDDILCEACFKDYQNE